MKSINIASYIRDYTVNFIEDFSISLNDEISSGSFFIIDSNVYRLYFEKINIDLPSKRYLIVDANERNKSIDKCKEIIQHLVNKRIRRNQRIVAIGGGVIQDITAFTASIYLRGIEWAFFPTTLLAQADSCIGGKTSINLDSSKNVIGNFYPPVKIYLDVGFLNTLSKDDIKSGIGEILHFYFYSNSTIMVEMINNYDDLIADPQRMLKYIKESLLIKKSVIETDEFDKGERNKFNYGHTFGHAIETATNYKIKHGLAVTVGMDLANYVSNYLGLLDSGHYKIMKSIIKINFPIYDWKIFDIESFYNALLTDKKNDGNNLGCILTEGSGRLLRKFLPINNDLKKLMNNYFDTLQ